MTEQELVRQCLVEVYRRNGYEDATSLTQRDHEHISQEIESKTTILISVSTLKRLLNGEFSRIPQTATLNAIFHYLGYKGWQEYKVSVRAKQTSFTVSEPDAVGAHPEKQVLFGTSRFKRIVLTLLGLVSVVAAVPFIQFSGRASVRHADKAEFSAEKTTANDMPNTVIFHYNIDHVQADSFFIQQSWDVNRRVRIFKNNYTLTDIYYEPGYHVAKLIANDSVIKVVEVSIPTDRWFLFAKDLSTTSIPQYLSPEAPLVKDGIFRVDKTDLEKSNVDLSVEKNFIYAFFPSKLEVSSDHYIFKTRIRVREVRNNHCPSLMVEAWPQRYFMFFRTSLKGCANQSMLQFGEQFLHGKTSDLSSLGYDVRNWTNVEVKVENRKVTISFDGKKVFTTTYQRSAGLLTGLAFVSNGIPEIDFVEVKGLDGTVLYQNDFSQLP